MQWISLTVCLLIALGLYWRHRPRRHIPLMLTAFTADIGMVLYIELTRDAIKTSLHPPHPFVTFHVIVSVLVVLAYFIQIFFGFRLWKTGTWRKSHRSTGMAFIVLRLVNFVTSLKIEDFIR